MLLGTNKKTTSVCCTVWICLHHWVMGYSWLHCDLKRHLNYAVHFKHHSEWIVILARFLLIVKRDGGGERIWVEKKCWVCHPGIFFLSAQSTFHCQLYFLNLDTRWRQICIPIFCLLAQIPKWRAEITSTLAYLFLNSVLWILLGYNNLCNIW